MVGRKDIVSPKRVAELVRYDALTGKLFWLPRQPTDFDTKHNSPAQACAAWNTRYSGKECFTAASHGYLRGGLLGINMAAHRVAWVLAHGFWPKNEIDHANGNRSDNRLENLRHVSHQENARNQKRKLSNTSGHTGVAYSEKRRKWVAYIRVDYRKKALGRFDRKSDAVAARKSAEAHYGFHHNHGRLA